MKNNIRVGTTTFNNMSRSMSNADTDGDKVLSKTANMSAHESTR